jgi:hypothetical protein
MRKRHAPGDSRSRQARLSMPDEQASNAAQIKQASVKAVTPSGDEVAMSGIAAAHYNK